MSSTRLMLQRCQGVLLLPSWVLHNWTLISGTRYTYRYHHEFFFQFCRMPSAANLSSPANVGQFAFLLIEYWYFHHGLIQFLYPLEFPMVETETLSSLLRSMLAVIPG
ncbi:hypothetical protein L228DRAFT_182357 [Xylona heveae TC161]|uniref:Uncharacterized protein n=1 Tax=Xylona heveae (strain CBS 132557 / TC161) TaxID=1328760 RepID=A0A165FFW8_XYLHT|nr:hypothetical protein L228DRAFT_182357 [Xylona heveae TC161]KZF20929.1 hypothetical protein L228DRAFT_182357 [Xylona heveae TC161]